MHSKFCGVLTREGSHLYSFEVTWNPDGPRAVWIATVRDENGRILATPAGELHLEGRTSERLVRSHVEARIARLHGEKRA